MPLTCRYGSCKGGLMLYKVLKLKNGLSEIKRQVFFFWGGY